MKTYDSIVVGGGPAGLSAAIYLARLARSVLVIDSENGRSSEKQTNDNYLGFPKGVKARKLLELGRKQAKRFGVEFVFDEVKKASRSKKVFSLKGKERYSAKTLVLATGVKDLYPSFPGIERYIGKSVFWCLLCDGYKVRNKKVVVVGHDDKAAATAAALINFTRDITFLTNCDENGDHMTKKGLTSLKNAKIPIVYGSIKKVSGKNGMLQDIELDNGEKIKTEFMFSKQGYMPRSEIAASLCAVIEGEGFVKVDRDQRTNIPFLYAAGDVTHALSHQIVTAAHEGATAAISADEDLLLSWQKEG